MRPVLEIGSRDPIVIVVNGLVLGHAFLQVATAAFETAATELVS
jgi:hypothetical protein